MRYTPPTIYILQPDEKNDSSILAQNYNFWGCSADFFDENGTGRQSMGPTCRRATQCHNTIPVYRGAEGKGALSTDYIRRIQNAIKTLRNRPRMD